MLKIYKEIYDINDIDVWSDAVDTLEIVENQDKSSDLLTLLEENFPDGATETEINDFIRFESDYIFKYLGINEEEEDY